MPIVNRIADLHGEITAWRHDFHRHPELMYDVHRTAARVAELLGQFGCDEVVTGIGRTGVVGVIRGRRTTSGRTIGLRADMDALPVTEKTGLPHASTVPGRMHACGHDGHTAMLLGAARYLAETRNFDGTAVVVFQPAEEGGAGGRAMVEDGLMTRFGIDEIYGMHNLPGLAVGRFAIREGGIMAATDEFAIEVTGTGGHAALPHLAVDPIVIAAHIVVGLQTLVSRNVDPIRSAVVSVTVIHAGEATNVIPGSVSIKGTARTLDAAVQDQIEQRLGELVPQLAAAHGGRASVSYRRGYPVTVNAAAQTAFAAGVARGIVGADKVEDNADPVMGGEDFSFMARERPGAFIFVGNGDSAKLHQDGYDFEDETIPVGCSYWVRLVQEALPVA